MTNPSTSFPHHEYTPDLPPHAGYRFLTVPAASDFHSEETQQRLGVVGETLTKNNVSAIYLVHGTFVGNDPLGTWETIEKRFGKLAGWCRRAQKSFIDGALNDHGSYPKWLARDIETSINGNNDKQPVTVHRFNWSSRNNHLGRALATLELLARLARDNHSGRVILWGHSHGGNVMALLTNLLRANRNDIERFLAILEPFLASPGDKDAHYNPPPRVTRQDARELLLSTGGPLRNAVLDFVTFGTPVRHCWTLNEPNKLMHFVNHRPIAGQAEYLGKNALSPMRVFTNLGDDFVQQIGIAGSNFAPCFFCPKSAQAERALKELFQPNISWKQLLGHVASGRRLPDVGTTLFADYVSSQKNWWAPVDAGHLIYTRKKHLLFHLEQMVEEFYGN